MFFVEFDDIIWILRILYKNVKNQEKTTKLTMGWSSPCLQSYLHLGIGVLVHCLTLVANEMLNLKKGCRE